MQDGLIMFRLTDEASLSTLPPRRPYDHKIPLTAGATPPHGPKLFFRTYKVGFKPILRFRS